MINTRNGHLVLGRHAIPVREVTNAVCDRKDMDYICSRYPLKPDEVMAVSYTHLTLPTKA